MKKPTDKQIESEIELLKKYKPLVPRRSMFGDDNYEKIDLAIEILEDRCESVEEAYDFVNDLVLEGGYGDDKKCDLDSTARDVVEWMQGESTTSPASDWASLANRK